MTDFDLQQQLLAQRRDKFAGQREFRSPQGQMVGRHFVAPNALQFLAEGLRSYGGIRGQEMAEKELTELSGQRKQATADALRRFGEQAQGRPADMLPPDQAGPVRPAQAPDMQGAFAALMEAPDAGLRQAGMQGIVQAPQLEAQAAERATQRDFQRQQAELQNQQRMEQLKQQHDMRMEALSAQNASRADMMAAQQQFQREMTEARRSMQSQPQAFFQPIQTAQGVFAFNARTGQMEAVSGPDGRPVVGAQADPALQGGIAAAKTAGQLREQGQSEARGDLRRSDMFISQLDQAEQLLQQKPTASGVGAMRDAAGRMIGINTKSADTAGQLEALSGWLVANVPRMEGPQSNFDVQNYMNMAGKIGDRTIPVSERLAAAKSVRELQEKYKSASQGRLQNNALAPNNSNASPKARMKFDSQGNPIQ